jgi:hypothetical protein
MGEIDVFFNEEEYLVGVIDLAIIYDKSVLIEDLDGDFLYFISSKALYYDSWAIFFIFLLLIRLSTTYSRLSPLFIMYTASILWKYL